MPKFRYRVFYVTADDTSLVIADVLLRRNQSQRSCFAVAVYGCGCLGRNRLIITRAVRHLAITTFGNDRWQHDLWQFLLDVAYLDIYLFYVSGGSVAEWLACWTQAQKGLGSIRSRDAVG